MEGSSRDTLAVASGPPAPLILFAAVHKNDVATCKHSGMLPRWLQGSNAYVMLRAEAADALERACCESVDTHALLKVRVSAEALVRLTVTRAGVENRFAPMLHKRTYADNKDWKVWHYCGYLHCASAEERPGDGSMPLLQVPRGRKPLSLWDMSQAEVIGTDGHRRLCRREGWA